jgi:hypothetical protein
MESTLCKICGEPFILGKALYCTNCGNPLTIKKKSRLIADIEDIESEPIPYGALRFVIGMINVLGWVVIISTSLIVALSYSFIRTKFGDDNTITVAISIMIWCIGLIFGTVIIAQAQIVELMLDIRNDMHVTRRFIRRFGLYMFKKAESTTE